MASALAAVIDCCDEYRGRLPQLAGTRCITDGGMETTLIFHRGLDLPLFASFGLLAGEDGTRELREYFAPYVTIARQHGVGMVLDTPTWRASSDWGDRLGHSSEQLDELNRKGVALLEDIRADKETERTPVVICGCIGPRGDGYAPSELMTADQAEEYHSAQVNTFRDTAADLIGALTMTYADEAIGIVRAAQAAGMPVAVSFTVETDGRLPSGQPLRQAIEQVDAATEGAAAYFMINCAHPTHFSDVLDEGGPWLGRIRGIRANASTKNHAELDEGNPSELGAQYRELVARLPALSVLGGCCGNDHRHIEEICTSCSTM
ncbi:homocysteine S-methyltransferase family protein [soil metagenome]